MSGEFTGSAPEAGRTRLGMVDGMLDGIVDGTVNGAVVGERSTVSPETSAGVAGVAAGFGRACGGMEDLNSPLPGAGAVGRPSETGGCGDAVRGAGVGSINGLAGESSRLGKVLLASGVLAERGMDASSSVGVVGRSIAAAGVTCCRGGTTASNT